MVADQCFTTGYGITANKIQGGDCSTGGGLLNPFNGATGTDCTENDKAACAIGDLSGKHGAAVQATGGAGTGYFTLKFVGPHQNPQPDLRCGIG